MRAPRTLFLRRLRRSRISRTSSRRAPLGISVSALGLGAAAFAHYPPPALSGDNGSFDPARNGR